MAEEIRGAVSGGSNGERLELNIKERTLGLTTKDLLPVLLLLLVAAMGYYRTVTLDRSIQQVSEHLHRLDTGHDAIKAEIHQQTGELRTALARQDDLLDKQTAQLNAAVHRQEDLRRADMGSVRQMLSSLLYSLQHPGQALPLDVPPPPPEKPERR